MEKLIKVRIDINGNEFFPHHEREGRYYYDKDETMCQFKSDCTVMEEPKNEAPKPNQERIQFNIEAYNTGKFDVVTRDGKSVHIVAIDNELSQPIVGIHNGVGERWSNNGGFVVGSKSGYDLFMVPKISKSEFENAEHAQKLEHLDVAGAIAGFKFKPKDLDMIVTVYELLLKFGGKLDLDTITKAQYEVEQRHTA